MSDLKLESVHYDEGEPISMAFSGEPAQIFISTLINFFEENGGKNYLAFEVGNSEKRYEICINNIKDGTTTAPKDLNILRQRVADLESTLLKIAHECRSEIGAVHRMGGDDCHFKMFRKLALEAVKGKS